MRQENRTPLTIKQSAALRLIKAARPSHYSLFIERQPLFLSASSLCNDAAQRPLVIETQSQAAINIFHDDDTTSNDYIIDTSIWIYALITEILLRLPPYLLVNVRLNHG